jgi:hypothetical protein
MNIALLQPRRVSLMAGIAAMLFILPAHADTVVTDGLQAYYSFGGNTNDESGNAHALTLSGASLSTDRFGATNQSLSFDGNVATASLNYSLANQSFSVGAWLYQPNLSQTEAGGFAQGSVGSAGQAFRFMIDYYGINNLIYSFWYDDFYVSTAGSNRDDWIHLFATFDNDTLTRKTYVDGVLVGTNVAAYGFSGTGPLQFGYMTGSMDEVRVYNRALTDSEVGQIHTSESSPVPESASTLGLVSMALIVLGIGRRRFVG